MKLYNHSVLSDEVLKPIIKMAGMRAGARTSNVAVKVTGRKNARSIHGRAFNCDWVNEGILLGKLSRERFSYGDYFGQSRKILKGKLKKYKYVTVDGGYFHIILGIFCHWMDEIDIAKYIFDVCVHEWKHIADFQSGEEFKFYDDNYRKKIKWEKRPQEIRAVNKTDEVRKKAKDWKYQEAILNLAVEIERIRKETK